MFALRQIPFRLRHAAAHVRPFSQSIRGRSPWNPFSQTPRINLWLRRLLYFGSAYYVGLKVGRISELIYLTAPPVLGSTEEDLTVQKIHQWFDHNPLVKQLRGNPDWSEVYVYGNYSEEDKEQRLTSGPLGRSSGVALQKVFWNNQEKKAINIVFFGNGTEGWPFVIHGGALATVLDEHLARVAIQNLPERTAVTANLDVTYRKPAFICGFYAIHATLDQERSTDRKAYVKGEVRNYKGDVVTEATGLFVVPRGYKLRKLGETY
ncbi:HotDog domain-containing protein [Aspergillus karnatakaensis]|uniref:PaaI family thioesterase n=1 Tax=Aspergillus karnatakaensis TaxID=1810916 RepID=UPI003CCD9A27